MNLVNIDTAQDPVVCNNINFLTSDDYPFCIVGVELKNNYDQRRLCLKNKPIDIGHKLPSDKLNLCFFRGYKITIKQTFLQLVKTLAELNLKLSGKIEVAEYQNILSQYNLSCDECFAHMRPGVYPIDIKHLNTVFETALTVEDLYNNFNTKNVPPFQAYSSFVCFILCNETPYRVLS